MSKKYTGIVVPISTPIDAQENVDEAGMRRLVEHTVETGMHGVFVAGSNGETMGLTQQERDRAIRIAIDQAGGRVPVMAGVMDTGTRRVIDNIKRLEQMGGKAAVVTPIFYARATPPSETIRHFEEISKQTSVDILVYNIPSYTNCSLSAQTVFELAKIDKVVGYKDSSGNMVETLKCLYHFRGSDFCILQGMVQLAAVSVLLGADGFVPSIGTAFPKVCLKVYEAAKNRDVETMMLWGERLNQCMTLCGMSANGTSSTKCALSAKGLFSDRVTMPLEPVTREERDRIFEKTKLFIEQYEQ